MFEGMELSEFSNDGLEQLLTAAERKIGQGRALQMLVLAEIDVRQMAAADGARSLSE